MKAIDRKLLRDLWQMRSQVVTVALVVGSAFSGFAGSLATYYSLEQARERFYESARFGHVFADIKRAPREIERRLAAIPGVNEVETTVVFDVTLDVAGVAEPIVGRMIGLPESGPQRLDRLVIRRGRAPERGASSEVVISEAFAVNRDLGPGMSVTALVNGRKETLHIVGVGLSPDYIFATRGGAFPDDRNFGVLWIARDRLAAAYDMEGAFNHVTVRLTPGATERAVIDALDRLLEPYGGMNAYGRDEQLSHRILSQEINQWKVTGTLIPSIFLAVAAFLLNVVLNRQVATQREQIAALKALGYGNGAIAAHYLQQVVVIVCARHRDRHRGRLLVGRRRDRAVRGLLPLSHVQLCHAALGHAGGRGGDAGCGGGRGHGRGAQRRDPGTGRGNAPAVTRALRADAARASRPRPPALARDADGDPQHGAPPAACSAHDRRHGLGGGDHHLGAVLARCPGVHDRRPVRGGTAGRRRDRAGRAACVAVPA